MFISSPVEPIAALEYFADYQRAQGLSANTIRNRESILRAVPRTHGKLVDADVFTLRRYVGRGDIAAGTRRTIRGALIVFNGFLLQKESATTTRRCASRRSSRRRARPGIHRRAS